MSITRTLNAYLDHERVHYYDVLPHPEAIRAVEIGRTLETPDAIRMRYWDFAALVFPVVTGFHRSPTEVW